MHERNIYNTPPNFGELAKKYAFFAPFLTLDTRGVPRINFKDDAALRGLSRALLLQDFGLDVFIPDNVLVPTVPLRLNYILWIEDLLGFNQSHEGENVRGIDIGTGATAVYALLGAKKNKWRMTGTEIHSEYVKVAQDNVKKNGLSELITVVPAKSDSIFGEVLPHVEDGHYCFTMCNPPFFASDEETDSVAKGRFSEDDQPLRSPPSAAKTGQRTELVAEGGELKFVESMIRESLRFSQKVRIFTTMLGIKRHLKQLTSELRTNGVANYTTTEFIQGKTTRWGLAWSFYPGVHLIPPHPDITGVFANFSTLLNFESLIHSYLTELNLQTLRWLPTASDDPEAQQVLEVIADINTWSHQRRKRREMDRQQQKKSPGGPPAHKVPKLSENETQDSPSSMECDNLTSSSSTANPSQLILTHFLMDFIREGSDAKLVLRFRGGSLGKDGMNQILQFLKNRFKKDCEDCNSLVYQMMNSGS